MCARQGDSDKTHGYHVIDLNYVGLYLEDLEKGKEFYSKLFGPPIYKEGRLYGWKMGAT